jgi:hypothetical protein
LSGLEFSFKSGTKAALLYDTMKELERADEFLKINGRLNAFSLLSKLIGMPLGSFLFVIRPQLPYWVWFINIFGGFFTLTTSGVLVLIVGLVLLHIRK